MPTYDYECPACKHHWELFQSMSAKPIKACPSCGKKTAKRLIGVGAAVLFKGGGFYQTDYRSDSYKKAAEADKKASEPAPAATATDAKPGANGAAAKPGETKKQAEAPAAAAPKTEPKPAKDTGKKTGKNSKKD